MPRYNLIWGPSASPTEDLALGLSDGTPALLIPSSRASAILDARALLSSMELVYEGRV